MSAHSKNWVVVDASVLPEVILKTLTVKRMLANREEKSSSSACRAAGISRSAFYKLTDANANVLTLNQSIPVDGAATVTVTFRLEDSARMSALVSTLAERKGVVEVRLLSGS